MRDEALHLINFRASAGPGNDTYIDRQAVTDEVTYARRLSTKFNWALLDVTRRSIEETAAAILKLFTDRQRQRLPEWRSGAEHIR
jgi:regulator of PEP synthase PpsR (kinase-PPPase family)